jgi:hypothetical protein
MSLKQLPLTATSVATGVRLLRKAASVKDYKEEPHPITLKKSHNKLQFLFFMRMAGGGADIILEINRDAAADLAQALITILNNTDTARKPTKAEVAEYLSSLMEDD